MDRPRIETINEKYGEGVVPPDIGGAWLVQDLGGVVLAVCGNRYAAGAALYAKADAYDEDPESFQLSVWEIHEEWSPKEEES